jgi:hypothetical protein
MKLSNCQEDGITRKLPDPSYYEVGNDRLGSLFHFLERWLEGSKTMNGSSMLYSLHVFHTIQLFSCSYTIVYHLL